MEMTVRMPANYNIMTEEEMTYTTGGAGEVVALATTVVWAGIGIATLVNWVDMLLGARSWYAANRTGDVGTDLENAANAWVDFTTSSVLNCVRSVFGTLSSISGPIGWIGTIVAFATV